MYVHFLLRYNSHNIELTILKWTIQCSTCIMLCDYLLYSGPSHSHQTIRKLCRVKWLLPISPSLLPLVITNLSSGSMDLPRLCISYKQNDTICDLSCLVSFCCSIAKLCPILCDHVHCSHEARQPSQSFTISRNLLKPSHSLLPPSPPDLNLSQHQSLFEWGSQSTGASASPSVLPVEYSGLISFRVDWLDLLKVQGTFKLLSQEYSPAPQLESINPSALSLINGPTLTSLYLQ